MSDWASSLCGMWLRGTHITIAANEVCDREGDIPVVQNAVYIDVNCSEHPGCSEHDGLYWQQVLGRVTVKNLSVLFFAAEPAGKVFAGCS